MSAAWDGYEATRSPRHHRRKRLRRLAVALGLIALVLSVLLVVFGFPRRLFAQALPMGQLRAGRNDNPADAAVVVYNDADPLSRDLADFYAEKRGIAADRLVALHCPTQEDISREEYDTTIAAPLRAAFDRHGWWQRTPDQPGAEPSSTVTANRIRFLVLMRGLPLRIKPASGYAGDFCNQPSPIKDSNSACVDSELAALGLFTRGISGVVPNPLFRSFARYSENGQPGILYTGRLDAPTGTMVRRMIEDSLAVEKTGLWGRCYVDARGIAPGSSPLAIGDEWMTKIATETAPRILPTVFDDREALFPVAYPLNDAAMYFGWYSEQPAGPFTRAGWKFRPGAVACHIHSFSATTLRDPSRYWVAPLLDRGADAVLGNVYEPYLTLTTHLSTFTERLTEGYTFAESAWIATPGLSWMNTVVGDPLYRPGKAWKEAQFDLADAPARPGTSSIEAQGRAYYQAAQIWHDRDARAGAAALEKSAGRLHSGLLYEGLGGLTAGAGDTARALKAYDQAVRMYHEPSDKVRVTLSEAQLLTKSGQKEKSDALLSDARKRYADNPSAAALDE